MATRVGTLSTLITADPSGFSAGIRTAKDEALKFKKDTTEAAEEVKSSWAELPKLAGGLFDSLKGGNLGGIFSELKTYVVGTSEELGINKSAWAGWASSASTAIGATIGVGTALVGKLREVTKELKDLDRFAKAIGVSTRDAQVLQAGFARAGLNRDESTGVINKLSEGLGELRNDPRGQFGQTLRRLGLDPNQINAQGVRTNIEQIVQAVSRLDNAYDRNAAANRLFGKSYEQLIPLFSQGSRVFTEAAERVRTTGVDESTVRAGVDAERAWGRVGRTFDSLSEKIKNGFAGAIATLSLMLAEAVEKVIGWAKTALEWLGLLESERDRVNREDAESRGIGADWGAAAPRTAADRLAELDASGPRVLRENDIALKISEEVEAMRERLFLERNVRAEAEQRGLVTANATRAEVEGVRDLVQRRRELVSRGATAAELSLFDQQAGDVATSRRDQAVAMNAERQEEANRLTRLVELEGLSAAQAQARLDRERGVTVAVAERNRLATEENVALQTRHRVVDAQLTIEQRLTRERQALEASEQRGFLTRRQAMIALGSAAEQMARLTNGPASLALDGTGAGSVEAARMVADRQERSARTQEDRLQAILDALDAQTEQNADRNRILEALGERLDNLERVGVVDVEGAAE